MRSSTLNRIQSLENVHDGNVGLFLVEDFQGDVVKISNCSTGLQNDSMPREEARLLVECKPCLWIGRYDGHVKEEDRHKPQPKDPRYER